MRFSLIVSILALLFSIVNAAAIIYPPGLIPWRRKHHHNKTSSIHTINTRTGNMTLPLMNNTKGLNILEPRRDFPDWTVRPHGNAPCPGWPGRKYFNETHYVEWRFRCFCNFYGKYDPECKVPEHYGWGNGQNDAVQGQVKCLKETWWGCAKTEKPKNINDHE